MMLESYMHPANCFLTLTYAPEHYPEGGTLVPEHLKNFWKRLRKCYPPGSVRYFACGEYGDKTQRAHYHAMLFGVSPADIHILEKCWPYGHVHVGTVTLESCAYVAGYVCKKWTNGKDPQVLEKLNGRHPEFVRMSLKPGIGAPAMERVADVLYRPGGSRLLAESGDVPGQLLQAGKPFPLGRYLKQKLRDQMDVPKPDFLTTPEGLYHVAQMLNLHEAAPKGEGLHEVLARKSAPKIERLEKLSLIYQKPKRL